MLVFVLFLGSSLPALCSAAAIALFLYSKGAIFPARRQRATLGIIVFVLGVFAMSFLHARVFGPRIALCWIALAFLAYLGLGAMFRRPAILHRLWTPLDIVAAAGFIAAAVYWLARIESGQVDENPLLILLVSMLTLAACIHLVHELDRASVLQRPNGLVFAQALLIAALLPLCFGFHRAGIAGLCVAVVAIAVLASRLRAYFQTTEERRILEKMSEQGDRLQPEYTEASTECPEPRLWSMFDPMTAEIETLDLLYSIVRALKPKLVVETGTFSGISSTYIARAMQENGRGRLITCEMDPAVHANACERFRSAGLDSIIDCRLGSSLELNIDEEIDLIYSDSDLKIRGEEVRRFINQINPFGLILIHDASSQFKIVREAALHMEAEGLISVVLLSTPRGLVIAQRRQGRR